ncbi:MAG: hypothetical protein AAF571_03160, partial [Verrucomicrobiota bacterium]
MKILIHKTDHLGDFVLALPALWECRKRFGDELDLHILVSPQNLEWQKILPWLGMLHPVRHPRYIRSRKKNKWIRSGLALSTALRLRTLDFDWGIDLVSTKNDLLGKWLLKSAGCRQTSGPDGWHSWLLDRKNNQPDAHQTEILASRFPSEWKISGASSPEQWWTSQKWKDNTPSNTVIFAPFAGHAFKMWPNRCWVELFNELQRDYRVKILVTASDLKTYQTFLQGFSENALVPVQAIHETLNILKNC